MRGIRSGWIRWFSRGRSSRPATGDTPTQGWQGYSVALGADGNSAFVGGIGEASGAGGGLGLHSLRRESGRRTGRSWRPDDASAPSPVRGEHRALRGRDNRTDRRPGGQRRRRRGLGLRRRQWLLGPAGIQAHAEQRERGTPTSAPALPLSLGWGHRAGRRPRTTTRPLGAAWVFTRTNSAWTQQASRVGLRRGRELRRKRRAFGPDGNTALIGSPRRERRLPSACSRGPAGHGRWDSSSRPDDAAAGGVGLRRRRIDLVRREDRSDRRRRRQTRGPVPLWTFVELEWHLDAGRLEADPERRERRRRRPSVRPLRRALRRRVDRADRRPGRQQRSRCRLGVHRLERNLDTAGGEDHRRPGPSAPAEERPSPRASRPRPNGNTVLARRCGRQPETKGATWAFTRSSGSLVPARLEARRNRISTRPATRSPSHPTEAPR